MKPAGIKPAGFVMRLDEDRERFFDSIQNDAVKARPVILSEAKDLPHVAMKQHQ